MGARSRREGPEPKRAWRGVILSVQPRIRLTRSFDERTHSYLGYVLALEGDVDGEARRFTVAVSERQHADHGFRVGDTLAGSAHPVADARTETAEFYRASGLRLTPGARSDDAEQGPPWRRLAPALAEYRERGHRRLAARTYAARCGPCVWGCEMAVEIVVDPWNPGPRRYRRETFCYGPLSCALYAAGPTRTVPGRNGMRYEEEDWVDVDATRHRGPDE